MERKYSKKERETKVPWDSRGERKRKSDQRKGMKEDPCEGETKRNVEKGWSKEERLKRRNK